MKTVTKTMKARVTCLFHRTSASVEYTTTGICWKDQRKSTRVNAEMAQSNLGMTCVLRSEAT